ncbi:MAG: serine hydrolase [Gemmatimonadaceae bacterium]|nr:serine hydrolase [Gemmatimonadaceae bacterium]
MGPSVVSAVKSGAALAALGCVGRALPAQVLPERVVDSIVTRALKAFPTPGVAVVVVQDGKVVVAKGYGVKTLGDTARVTPTTRFGIASNTKVFTATALGLLVEEGKLEWDAPVIRYLPQFAMYDPFVTRELTVRDLLVHRSGLGLGAGDLLWWPASTYSRKDIMYRLRFIKPATSFRSAYAYDNVLYLVAGEIIESVSGMSWERFVEERILRKVGMTHTTSRHGDAAAPGDVATTHAPVNGALRVIAPMTSDNTNPAGGINSGAIDMAKWVLTQLDSGKVADGTRLFRASTARQLWAPVTPTPIGTPPPELAPLQRDFGFYALGLNVIDFRGRKTLHHTGGLPGYLSSVAMVPSARAAVVVLTNDESSTFLALTWALLDRALNAPSFDWIGGYAALTARQDRALVDAAKGAQASPDSVSRPSLALEKYAGTYEDAWYGDVTVTHEQGTLVMRFSHTPQLVGDMVPWQHDTFLVRWRDRELRADAYATFALLPDGRIDQVKLLPASPDVDFSFDFADLLLQPKRAARP